MTTSHVNENALLESSLHKNTREFFVFAGIKLYLIIPSWYASVRFVGA